MIIKKKKIITKNFEFGLVTGASGFLGEVHCYSVLENYNGLIVVDINKKKLDSLTKILKKKYPNKIIEQYIVDITKEKQIINLFQKLNKNKIFVRTLINNACIDAKPNSKYIRSKFDWTKEFEVSLKGPHMLIEYFSKKMKMKKNGCILNIASDLSVIAPSQKIYTGIYKNYTKPLSYSVIKHGLIGLTKYYAALFGKFNITCNAISPVGVFNNHKKKFVKNLISLIPMKRMATKEDIKNTVSFFINKKQKFITGQNILIDGGRTII
jgi:NAD(P)-dependent dehydrogenase (short-subunit alcohol dehydrogenase family)